MQKIIYYVASSIDGYISGVDNDISGFVPGGNGIDQYLEDLKKFTTVIMGRNTYEFGYAYGLKPGQLAYDHMEHYIFSDSLTFDDPDPRLHVCKLSIDKVQEIRKMAKGDIYLCGGGMLASWLLDHEQIDILKVKLNPAVFGRGVKLFGNSQKFYKLDLIDSKGYEHGLLINEYAVKY